jgi:hypothetical protein
MHFSYVTVHDRCAVAIKILMGVAEGMPHKKYAPCMYESQTAKNVCKLKKNENS